jgi:hypothetical protein
MKKLWITSAVVVGLAGLAGILYMRNASAHCDTMDGPVVVTAQAALEGRGVTPVLKWVKADQESELRRAFHRTLAVRSMGPEAKELADMYFFETLVRLHRAAEGAPYTGLKPAGAVEPIVAASDKALETGSADTLVRHLTEAVGEGIRERFARAHEAKQHADESVAAGREFVAAYVEFTHYVERLHANATGGAVHGESTASHGTPDGHHE